MLEFLLGHQKIRLAHIDPNTTVLNYLRDRVRRTGAKEGCASGDCGACTVVLAKLEKGELRYETVNSCITWVGKLHGKELITVEDLAQKDALHPCQQAMVDCHGSQCGFCTPGFVMSLFCLGKKVGQTPSRAKIKDALAGNLCRCTGYEPIIAAAKKMMALPGWMDDSFSKNLEQTKTDLASITSICQFTDEGGSSSWIAPKTIQHLCKIYAVQSKASIVAGGTDLLLEQTQNLKRFDTLIDVSETKELNEIAISPDAIEIGAAVPIAKAFNILSEEFSDFAELLSRFGSLPIRNQATLGGNLGNASPIADLPPALIALNSQIHIRSESNSRTMSVEHFYKGYRKTALAPGEIIEKIVIPRKPQNGFFKIYKITKRWEDDISAVCGAFYLCLDKGFVSEVRIAFGGMAEIPRRALSLEEALRNQPWSMAMVESAAKSLASDFTPIDDVRASKEYRMTVAQNLVKKCFLEISNQLDVSSMQPVTTHPTRISHFE